MIRIESGAFVGILIYTPYIYAYNDRYIWITLLEYYYIFIIVAIVAVIFILDVLYKTEISCDSTRYKWVVVTFFVSGKRKYHFLKLIYASIYMLWKA